MQTHILAPVLIVGFPLVAAFIALFLERKKPKVAALIATAAIGLSFLTAAGMLLPGAWGRDFNAVARPYADEPVVTQTRNALGAELGAWPEPAAVADRLNAGLGAGLGEGVAAEWTAERVQAALDHRPFEWLEVGDMTVRLGFHLDPLAIALLVMVTLAAFMIHVFSLGYMDGDPRFGTFFRWIGFFTCAMLGLVVSDNLLTLYVFWELMGLSSYKLIGFFYHKESAQEACKKAFMTTRIGDVGMFLGILVIYWQVGSFRYVDIFQHIQLGLFDGQLAFLASLGLFFGAMGKSAQFPLHVWLPDAMEGPTPVSALIHAATMVAAGVYLIARMYPLMEVHPAMLPIVAVVGTFTALFAGTIAIAATDIKKVLAYSTISQLGFMFAALGAGGLLGFQAGTFHLVTHAFFKACLFLGSGSVIHAVHTQEVGQMGGLWKKIPVTFATWMVATLAIAGFPFTAGFFSKDSILLALTSGWETGVGPMDQDPIALIRMGCMIGLVAGAALTAAYMMRVTCLTFFGQPRDQHRYDHAHESKVMTLPLVVLATLAIAAGYAWQHTFINPEQVYGFGYHPHWSAEQLGLAGAAAESWSVVHDHYEHWHHLLLFIAIPAGLGGLALGFALYQTPLARLRPLIRRPLEPLFKAWQNKYWIDEIYWATFVAGAVAVSRFLALFDSEVVDGFVRWVGRTGYRVGDFAGFTDREVVDGQFVHGAAGLAYGAGGLFSKMQGGRVRVYLYQAIVTTAVLALVIAAVYG